MRSSRKKCREKRGLGTELWSPPPFKAEEKKTKQQRRMNEWSVREEEKQR